MRPSDGVINLLLIAAGFTSALLVYNTFFLGGLTIHEMLIGSGVSVLAFWAAVETRANSGRESTNLWIGFIEQFCLGTGVNLVLHAILSYAFYIRRTPFLIAAGGLFSAALLTLWSRSAAGHESSQKRLLLIGFDSIALRILRLLREPVIGVVGSRPALVPADIPYLGDVDGLENTLKQYRPTNIVVSLRDWASRIPPAVLLNCRLSGLVLEESPAVYERLLSRVCCERLQPVDLLLSSALRGDSRIIAIQSVYTNLIVLALLLALAPLMLIVGIAVRLFSGPGPVLESFECAGFQYIPFRLLRFRTTRVDDAGTMTRIGGLIARLHLTDLPQLLNVVRGDMALVGPRPVRAEFARYLTRVMPFYSARLSVRPGIVGWAQTHAPAGGSLPDECREIEYDLFYVKEGSLWMDLEIMIESMNLVRTSAPAAVS